MKGRGKRVFGILIFLTVFAIIPALAEECNGEKRISIYAEFKSFEEGPCLGINGSTSTRLKQYDYLRLWRLFVLNRGNCKIPAIRLQFNLKSDFKNYSDIFSGYKVIVIPALQHNEFYELTLNHSLDSYRNCSYNVFWGDQANPHSQVQLALDEHRFLESGYWELSPILFYEENQTLVRDNEISLSYTLKESSYIVLPETDLMLIREIGKGNKTTSDLAQDTLIVMIIIGFITVIIEIIIGLLMLRKTKTMGEEQIKELKKVAKSIQDSTKEQIKETKKFEDEKKKNIILGLLSELESNFELSKSLSKLDNLDYLRKKIMQDFSFYNLNIYLSNYYIKDREINKKLQELSLKLNKINNILRLLREKSNLTLNDLDPALWRVNSPKENKTNNSFERLIKPIKSDIKKSIDLIEIYLETKYKSH